MHQTHGVVAYIAHKSAYQALNGTLALQMIQQRKQRTLTGVQADEVHIVEQARIAQLAQLGIYVAAAQSNTHMRAMRLDALRDAQRPVHGAGEGDRKHNQLRLVLFQSRQR